MRGKNFTESDQCVVAIMASIIYAADNLSNDPHRSKTESVIDADAILTIVKRYQAGESIFWVEYLSQKFYDLLADGYTHCCGYVSEDGRAMMVRTL